MKKILLWLAFFSASAILEAQQDAMFTKYMFNTLSYNPAFAGSRDFMTVEVLHRTQWLGIEGAPSTQSLTFHTPTRNERVGIGLNLLNDEIGPSHTISANFSYAYRIPIGKGKLAIGLQGGIFNFRSDWSKLTYFNPNDPAYQVNTNVLKPNFGAGLFYSSRYFFTGFSCPRLIEYDLRKDNVNTELYARYYRHYYWLVGGAIPLSGDDLVFRPMALLKNVGLLSKFNKDKAYQNVGAPTEVDIDLSMLFYQQFWLGAAYRTALEAYSTSSTEPNAKKSSSDSFDVWVSYIMPNGLRIGAAWDFPLSDIQQVTAGGFELMVGYEFNYKKDKVVTPRYF